VSQGACLHRSPGVGCSRLLKCPPEVLAPGGVGTLPPPSASSGWPTRGGPNGRITHWSGTRGRWGGCRRSPASGGSIAGDVCVAADVSRLLSNIGASGRTAPTGARRQREVPRARRGRRPMTQVEDHLEAAEVMKVVEAMRAAAALLPEDSDYTRRFARWATQLSLAADLRALRNPSVESSSSKRTLRLVKGGQ
jgi:hypothetical protein